MKTKKSLSNKLIYTFFIFFLSIAIVLPACDGPAGADGEQGPVGPAGPAGDDGSVIYSGNTTPDSNLGSEGDFYIDLSTAELYGPKDATGWGTPINLSGEDGNDGANGNSILNGQGNPTASIGAIGDFYIDTDNYNLWGPKGEAAQFNNGGWGVLPAINLQASANATLYIFDGYDFTVSNIYNFLIEVTEQELRESSWNVYLVSGGTSYHVPGYGPLGNSEYRVFQQIVSGSMQTDIRLASGSGDVFDEVRVVRVEVSNVVDNRTKSNSKSFGISDINFDNYEEVEKYFGLDR